MNEHGEPNDDKKLAILRAMATPHEWALVDYWILSSDPKQESGAVKDSIALETTNDVVERLRQLRLTQPQRRHCAFMGSRLTGETRTLTDEILGARISVENRRKDSMKNSTEGVSQMTDPNQAKNCDNINHPGNRDWNTKPIEEYFSKIGYPKISKLPKCVLIHKLGTVYIVEFDERVESIASGGTRTIASPPCYAIVKDGVVTGYGVHFWTDVNQHRLVLKQHIGMLEMEKAEKSAPEIKKQEVNSDRVEISPEVLNSIVSTYEEKIKSLNAICNYKVNSLTESLQISIQDAIAAKNKLKLIEDVISGKMPTMTTAKPLSEEEDAVTYVLGQSRGIIYDEPSSNESSNDIPGMSPYPAVASERRGSATADAGDSSLKPPYAPVPPGQVQSHISGMFSGDEDRVNWRSKENYNRDIAGTGPGGIVYPKAPNTPLTPLPRACDEKSL